MTRIDTIITSALLIILIPLSIAAGQEKKRKNESWGLTHFFYAIESIKIDHISPSGKWAVMAMASFLTG